MGDFLLCKTFHKKLYKVEDKGLTSLQCWEIHPKARKLINALWWQEQLQQQYMPILKVVVVQDVTLCLLSVWGSILFSLNDCAFSLPCSFKTFSTIYTSITISMFFVFWVFLPPLHFLALFLLWAEFWATQFRMLKPQHPIFQNLTMVAKRTFKEVLKMRHNTIWLEKRKSEHTERHWVCVCMEERLYEETTRWRPCASRERPQKKANLLTHWSWTSSI